MTPESQELNAQVEELLQFVYLMPVAIVKMGAQGAIQMINPHAVQLLEDLDLDPGEQEGATLLEALVPGLGKVWENSQDQVGEVCAPVQLQRFVDGHEKHLVLKLVRPDRRCTMVVIQDVTCIVEKEREIFRQKQRIGVVMEQIEGYCVVMLDAEGNMLEWNPSIERMFGTAARALEGQSVDKLLNPVALAEFPAVRFAEVETTIAVQGAFRAEAAYRTVSGSVIWGDLVATPTVEMNGRISGYVFVIRDVTEQRSSREQLLNEAMTDPLTGLLNRRGMEHRVSQWLGVEPGKSEPGSWIMADIDHFKKVNDTYGHAMGDEVLKLFAGLLQAATRSGDIIARVGGEEFVVLLTGAPITAALMIAERMRDGVAKAAMNAGGEIFYLTSSFGVVEQVPGLDWHAAVSAADAALYEAKSSGRNRVVAGRAVASPVH